MGGLVDGWEVWGEFREGEEAVQKSAGEGIGGARAGVRKWERAGYIGSAHLRLKRRQLQPQRRVILHERGERVGEEGGGAEEAGSEGGFT